MNHSGVRRTAFLLCAIAASIGLVAFYFTADPSSFRWMPKCPVYQLTGIECPGCGSQRALHALLHGRIAEAWQFNSLFVISIPVLGFMGFTEIFYKKFPGLYRRVYTPFAILAIAFVIVGWTVWRNLPF